MASKPPAPSDLADKFMLRMPEGMRERIATAARQNGRSMNSEIVARLEITTDRLLGDLNAYGTLSIMRRLEAHAQATEVVAQKLYYDLCRINGVGVDDDPKISEAIDSFVANNKDIAVNRANAIKYIIEDWLVEHNFMQSLENDNTNRPKDDPSDAC